MSKLENLNSYSNSSKRSITLRVDLLSHETTALLSEARQRSLDIAKLLEQREKSFTIPPPRCRNLHVAQWRISNLGNFM